MVNVFGNKATRFGFGEGLVELGRKKDLNHLKILKIIMII